MIVACHCEGQGWNFWGDSNIKGKFWGRSIQLDPVGVLTLKFDDGETYQWSKVTTSIYNIILGKLYCDHYGTMRIKGGGSYSCKLKFKEQSVIDRNPRQVHGFVQDNRTGEKVAILIGKWDEAMYYVLGDPTTKPKGYDPMTEAVLLWERDKSPTKTRYNLSPFAISLNEITPGMVDKLPPTDSRLRPDQRHLENGEYEAANAEKLRLEQLQRQARRLQEKGWKPRWFEKDEEGNYRYVGGYWEAREKKNWDKITDIFKKQQQQHVLLRLTFDNICIAGLGDNPGTLGSDLPLVPFAQAFEEATESTLFRFMIPPFVWKTMRFLDVGYEKGLRKAVEVVHEFVDKMVVERICKLKEEKTLGNRSDVLSRIIEIESHHKKSDEKDPSIVKFFRQFCTSFILAGRDTSSVALTWFFWVIQRHPEVENKIISEVREILRQRGDHRTSLFTVKELNDMVYLQAALSETMRLYPPIPMEMKQATEDDVFPDGTFLSKGSRVYFAIYAMGRMESIWGKDCEVFRPERWIQAGSFVSDDQFKYVVFNAGPRLCLGKTFAYLQMKTVAASVLLRYSVKVDPDHVVVPRVTTTLYMKHGLKVIISPRSLEEKR
ncbi:hypothetical protein F2Q70_00019785 [Brassica cretica]|uniref:Uncharacterized protein n=1 Tax=Brassica cretica TaxID=69181 RepID=A0A8S9GF82_BRACR|nr:hypothetical protein F2Q70_00019785 [Brassica cretica]